MAAQALTFETGLNAIKSLQLTQYDPPKLRTGQVLVKLLAAPINPQDLMVMKGLYPVKPEDQIDSSSIPGYDGVGEVVDLGDGVGDLKLRDHVIPKRHGLGTWRTHAAFGADALIKVSPHLDIQAAAILKMVVTPAYFLLEDMVQLKPGD